MDIYYKFCTLWGNITRSLAVIKLLWGKDDSDWSTLTSLMRFQMRRIRRYQLLGRHIGDKQGAKYLLIAEYLLRRMEEQKQDEIASARYPKYGKFWVQMIEEIEEQDMTMFLKMFKHLRCWWY